MYISRITTNNRLAFLSSKDGLLQGAALAAAFGAGILLSSGVLFTAPRLIGNSSLTQTIATANPEAALRSGVAHTRAPRRSNAVKKQILPITEEFPKSAITSADDVLPPTNRRAVTYELKSGDTLSGIWKTQGASRKDALAAGRALSDAHLTPSLLHKGENVELIVQLGADGAENEITSLTHQLRNGKVLHIEGSSESGYKAWLDELEITQSERHVSGTIKSSFSLAALEADVPSSVVDDIVDLFSDRIEFRKEVHPGDTFSVVYKERRLADGTLLDHGEILAASFQNSGHMLVAVRHVDAEGRAHYYDETGAPLGNYFLRYPLTFTRIASVFSTARFHPLLRISRPHNGVDFAAPIGTPVRTVGDGIVEAAGFRGEAGNAVIIRHGDRYSTAYFHLSKIAPGIRPGVHVTRGELIGKVGMTGLATGPHLHFSLFDHGTYVDPLKANLPTLSDGVERLPQSVLAPVLAMLREAHENLTVASAYSPATKG